MGHELQVTALALFPKGGFNSISEALVFFNVGRAFSDGERSEMKRLVDRVLSHASCAWVEPVLGDGNEKSSFPSEGGASLEGRTLTQPLRLNATSANTAIGTPSPPRAELLWRGGRLGQSLRLKATSADSGNIFLPVELTRI